MLGLNIFYFKNENGFDKAKVQLQSSPGTHTQAYKYRTQVNIQIQNKDMQCSYKQL